VEPSQTPDAFEEAAAKALSEPNPAVEREIFEDATKPEADRPDRAAPSEIKWLNDREQPVTFVNDKGEPITWTTDAASPKSSTNRKPPKSRRMRTTVGRSVQANDVTIILSVVSVLVLIDEKLALLRDERPNDSDTQAARDEAISHYESTKRDIEALRDVAFKIKHGTVEEKVVTRVTSTFTQGVRNWWGKRHEDICSKAYDATLFVSCVNLCALAGCGGTAAIAVAGALVGGKPVIEALRTLPKRLYK